MGLRPDLFHSTNGVRLKSTKGLSPSLYNQDRPKAQEVHQHNITKAQSRTKRSPQLLHNLGSAKAQTPPKGSKVRLWLGNP